MEMNNIEMNNIEMNDDNEIQSCLTSGRPQSSRHGRGILHAHVRGHSSGAGMPSDWCHHDAWN
jgi:hypothetical protein